MIQRKKKECKGCKLPKFIFSKGLCHSCWGKEYKKLIKKEPKAWKKERKRFGKECKNRKTEYKKARLEFLETHDVCQVNLPGCLVPYPIDDKSALQVHHMAGREGDLLFDKSKFLCVCNNCHRWITDHSREAIENGWSLSRHSKNGDKQ